MSFLSPAALSALHALVPPPVAVRAAVGSDVAGIVDLMAPHIASGAVLPRSVVADDFLVAVSAEGLEGCVALTRWQSDVFELGSLVTARPRGGVGRALVAAAEAEARARGARVIVALTASPAFFERCGWAAQADAPWARARGIGVLPDPDLPEVAPAVRWKAGRCAACPRLAGCGQVLLARRLARVEAA